MHTEATVVLATLHTPRPIHDLGGWVQCTEAPTAECMVAE
jgi:hypothetical protein